jgi:hypothetical protein
MPKSRRKTRIWIVLLLSILIFALIEGLDLLPLQHSAQGLADSQQLERIRLGLAILFWPLLPLGLYLSYFGVRTLKAGQFPPPGSRLITRASIETGRVAMIRGWAAIISGASLCVLALYGAVIVPGELASLLAG